MDVGGNEGALLFQARALGLPEPTLEHRFHAERRWRFDLAWLREKVACEIEGGTWLPGGSRHSRPEGFERDAEKYAEAAIAGWLVIRVTPRMVEDGRAIRYIERAIRSRQ